MSGVVNVLRWLGLGALGALAVAGLTVLVLRFGDGPTAIVAGGAFTSGERYAGEEPEWSLLRDRQEVEFQLLDPARSRTTWILEHEGRVYIPSGYMNSTWGRMWNHWPVEAERDGRALLRVDGVIYERQLLRVRDSAAQPYLLPQLAREFIRKYLGGAAPPAPGSAAFDGMVDAVLRQVEDESLWIFELAPPADTGVATR